MTQEQIEQIDEYNRLCAEFLGWYQENRYWKKIRPSDSCLIKDAAICHEYDLRFHSDWNWIMQIVKKISELSEAAEAKLNTDSTAFYVGVQAYLTPALMDADLDKVVKIIHLFMLEYNENKES